MLFSLSDYLRAEQECGEPQICDFMLMEPIARVIVEIQPLLAEGHVELRVAETQASVSSDPAMLEILLRILLLNAVFFSSGGKVLVGSRRAGERIRVLICDNGIGIPEDRFGGLFQLGNNCGSDPRDPVAGLGLGLPTAQKMAHQLGSELSLYSISGRGTNCGFVLPLAAPGT